MGRKTGKADPDYCRVIIRIREKTRRRVMDLLSASGHNGNLGGLVEDLLTQWVTGHQAKRPDSKRIKKPKEL